MFLGCDNLFKIVGAKNIHSSSRHTIELTCFLICYFVLKAVQSFFGVFVWGNFKIKSRVKVKDQGQGSRT